MKNQYFGDENDYKKYGLLNTLTGRGELPTAVCWMLTPDDSRSDGRFTDYLSQPSKWRPYDPLLYEQLRNAVVRQRRRDVQYAAEAGLVSGARYSLRTNRVVFFLLPQAVHVPSFERHIARVERVRSGQIVTREHPCA